MISPDEFSSWVLEQDDDLLVVNKPGDVVCHPSKAGPWSSLVGAAREYLGADAVHLVFRLDRETSGVVVFARTPAMASRLQVAAQERRYSKQYLAILSGELQAETRVHQSLGNDFESPVLAKSRVVARGCGQDAVTQFTPKRHGGGFTLASVVTETGRKHQIRAHAQWLGHPLVGDKIYGPDERLFLEFIERGWTPELEARLLLPRQALHCLRVDLRASGVGRVFEAPLPEDMAGFCRDRMGVWPVPL